MATLVSKDTSGIYRPREGEVEDIRTRTCKRFRQAEPGRFRVAGQIGPIHYRQDPFDEREGLKEIDLDLVAGAGCDHQCLTNGYQVEVWNSLQNSVGETVHYVARFTRAGHWFAMAPIALYWENDRRDRQSIGALQAGITPVVDNDAQTITWPNAFGPGLHFRYNLSPDQFSKTLVIDSPGALPAPTIQDRNTRLVLLLSGTWDASIIPDDTRFPAGFIPGEMTPDASKFYVWQWSLDSPTTFFFKRNDGQPLFWWQTPKAWDANGLDLPGYSWQVGTTSTSQYGGKFCVPWATLQAAAYPLSVDTAISEEQVGASTDDAMNYGYTWPGDGSFTATSTVIEIGMDGTSLPYYFLSGLRFQTIPIPQGAIIDSASLRFCAYSAGFPHYAKIYAEDVDSMTTFAATSHEPYDSYLARTAASADWDDASSWTVGNWYTSADVSAAVKEVVDRVGWAPNQHIGFVVVDDSGLGSGDGHHYRDIRSWNYSGNSYGPKFNCEYHEAPAAGDDLLMAIV